MTYTITYLDESGSMISPNNPTSYTSSIDGIIKLSAPSLSRGEFRGWYSDSGFTTQITQLDDSTIATLTNSTIYAKVQINTQLQILGGSISVVDCNNVSSNYILLTNSTDANNSRSLLAISPAEYSKLVSGSVQYIKATSGSVTAALTSARREYFIDVGSQTSLSINVQSIESAEYIIFHFTRGTNCTSSNIEFELTLTGVTIDGEATNTYDVSVGSTLILAKNSNSWTDGLYLNPSLNQISNDLINDSLSTRNYCKTLTQSFSASNSNTFGSRKSVNITLGDFNISQSESNVLYKSILVQFDMSAYSADGADATTLNNKQGYFNLINVQAAKITYANRTFTLTLTYDEIPAYSSSSLSGYTQNIPIRIMVVI